MVQKHQWLNEVNRSVPMVKSLLKAKQKGTLNSRLSCLLEIVNVIIY